MRNVLIDTDVLLDVLTDRHPFSRNSSRVISLCEKREIQGFVTPVIISNTYYLTRRIVSHQLTLQRIRKLLDFLEITAINKQVVIGAMNSEFTDFEDALQNYSAEFSRKVDTIITRNIKDFRKSKLLVMTPDEFLTALEKE